MLTSCPECGTTFRISSAELRVAEGLVRCGSCSATFNALLTLLDEAGPPREPATDAESAESEPGSGGQSPGGWDIGDTVEQPGPPPRPETEDEEAGAPVYLIDDWAADQVASELARPSGELDPADRAAEHFEAPGRPSAAHWPPEDEPRGFYFEDGEARAARAWRSAHEPRDEPEFVAATPPRSRSGPWGLGALLMLVLLGAQLVHAKRDALATHPGYGQLVRATYGALDLELYPAWPLSAYQITESEAVVAGGTAAAALDILGTITVQGADAVGPPLIRVTLRDRWSNALGERLLDAREYASDRRQSETLLQPGSTLPLQISLMDPGAEAIGYELDICIRYRQLGLRCQVDADPFVQ